MGTKKKDGKDITSKKKRNHPKMKNKKQSEKSIISQLEDQYNSIHNEEIEKFGDFPLSIATKKGLKECGYHKPTEIQKETIGLALNGKDILGAAQTGSGKTLAFLIPIIERLYVQQWTKLDGVGAIVITPTRELAYQIFETLRKIGAHHDFSAGLIIGGKDLKFERTRMDQCNIVICTPGRLLQHMDENPLFDCVNMKILVLDEADRCLDMGFEQAMNAIIANLPPKRQTLLFSATQTKSIKDLARLSLKDPCYISVHEHFQFSTPKELIQSYVVVNLNDKVSVLWSFLKNHPNKKIIVFFSSCKQVKYFFEIFCKLRPGMSLLALYGTLHQLKRMQIYENFCRKKSAILFATDLAARGLDFPEVHWVVQVDCPEDPETYIHRVGRTARYQKNGESLLMLLHSEIDMVDKLTEKKIPIQKIDINTAKIMNPVRKMEAFLARDHNLKESAQRAFVSYVKAVFLMKDKSVFNTEKLDTDSFAHSLGLAIPPRIRFLQRMKAKKNNLTNASNSAATNNITKKYFNSDSDDNESCFHHTVYNDLSGNSKNPSKSFETYDDEDDDGNDILKIKRINHDIEFPVEEQELETFSKKKTKALTKAALAKKMLKKNIIPNKKIVYTEEGEVVKTGFKEKQSKLAIEYELEDSSGIDIEKAKTVLREEDKFDKQFFKEKVKAKHKEAKRLLKEKKKKEEQPVDEFGESDSDEPDLSWLPDPDKIYGPQNKDDGAHEDRLEVNTDKEDRIEVNTDKEEQLNKRKRKNEKTKEKSQISKKKRKLEKISNSLSVNEAEQLALMLLNQK